MSQLFVLFEHAGGYALFKVKQFEEISMLMPQVEAAMNSLSKFQSIVTLASFIPFKTATNALDNANSVSEGIVHEDLRLFLDNNMPKSKKKQITLGVSDSKLAAAIAEELQLSTQHTGVVPEICRGIRNHFPMLVKGFTPLTEGKAQLGLGHSYSRCKVKFNVHRSDNMIIQSIALLDQLDKDINTFAMRIREWYSYHFPELVKIVPDNYLYAKVTKLIQNRKELDEEKREQLEEVLMDSAKVQAIFDASKSSMGMDISPVDLINIQHFASRVVSLAEYRKQLHEYLVQKMHVVAPNLTALIGEQVGARLISHAGSLTNLAKLPASTVQILGAEKALFRALKTRSKTPKYGLIYHSTFIGRAGAKNKGRISRFLANKSSLASRLDCFSEIPSDIIGGKMRQQVEDRIKFFETGQFPPTNEEVMTEALKEVAEFEEGEKQKQKKKKKKKKKAGEENGDSTMDVSLNISHNGEAPSSKKKKKKRLLEESQVEPEEEVSPPKKKKGADSSLNESLAASAGTPGSKKKKKKKSLVAT